MKYFLFLFSTIAFHTLYAQSTFHGNNARSGIYEGLATKSIPSLHWKFKTDGPIVSSPAVGYGLVFIGSADNNLYAIDEKSGQLKWEFKTDGRVNSSPAFADSLVCFGSADGNFYAVNANSGEQRWKFTTLYERRFQGKNLHGLEPKNQIISDSWDVLLSSPAIFNGRVYFGSGDGNVYALDLQTGLIRWKFKTNDVVHASPAIANNIVYIGSWDGSFYALDSENGELKWKFDAGVDPSISNHIGFQSSAVVNEGTIFVGCRDAHVYALDAFSGRKKWEYSTKTTWVSASPIVKDGIVYINANRLMAIDAINGKLKFSFEFPKVWGIASPILAGEQIFMGGFNGILYALNVKTGKTIWEFRTDGNQSDPLHVLNSDGSWNQYAFKSVFYDYEDDSVEMFKRFSVGSIMSTPTIANGKIYFGSTDGTVYSIY